MEEKIRKAIEEALTALGMSAGSFSVEHPAELSHGDYATNVALIAGKSVGKNPREVAEALLNELEGNIPDVERIEIAGPGFINFHLSRTFFTNALTLIGVSGSEWGTNDRYKDEKVMVEYTDPNPFKELHIGHLVPNALGESLAHLFEFSGAEVKRVTFQGDVGMHVAKAVWGLRQLGIDASSITPDSLGKAYATGATAFEEDEDAALEIKNLNKVIYERSDVNVNELYDRGKAVSIEYFEKAYELLGSTFERYFFESETGPIGKELVEGGVGTVFEKSDGAVIYRGEKVGLHTRVFINAEGLPTYEAKDIGLMKAKHDWWPFDRSITVTGMEQREYFKVVTSAASELMPDLVGKIELVPNGMLRLSEGKMSSRTGNVVRALDLIDDVTSRIVEKMADADIEDKEATATDVAVGAIKYTILKSASGRDIVFDFKQSISFEGDSGPYLQYTHARAQSVAKKARDAGIIPSVEHAPAHPYPIERTLYAFPEVIARATSEREPHYVVTYLTELAALFNGFYHDERIADASDEYAPYKLALTEAVGHTLKNGLRALGIQAPEAM